MDRGNSLVDQYIYRILTNRLVELFVTWNKAIIVFLGANQEVNMASQIMGKVS